MYPVEDKDLRAFYKTAVPFFYPQGGKLQLVLLSPKIQKLCKQAGTAINVERPLLL